jgi:hypothetical protein
MSDLSTQISVVMDQLDRLMADGPGVDSAQKKRWKRELILKLADLRRAEIEA